MPKRRNEELPLDIYIPFVQSLFRDSVTLAVGIAAQSLLALLVYFKTSDTIYFVVAFSIVAIGYMRLRSTREVLNNPISDRSEARRLENIYIFWGTLHASALGLFCFAGIYLAHDQFAEIAAICVTLATATSIAGRNYGSPRMVMLLIITLTMPISAGFLLRGDVFHVTLGLLSIPFFFAIRKFADNVRDVLFAALWEQKKANQLAARFDRALNTMSSGLVMLSQEGRVVVANAEAANLMQVSGPDRLLGRTLRGLLTRGAAGGMLSQKDSRYAEAQLTRALREGKDRKVLLRLLNGRHFEFSARESKDELGVITFDEVTARVEAEERIRFMARFDSLTGLPNRAYFHELLSERIAGGDQERTVGLAVFDLDDFKSINDTLGHPVGDGLIYLVAERLGAFADGNIEVSRFGGDEFMIFFNDVKEEQEFAALLDGIFASLHGDVDVAGHAIRIQLSAGAVLSKARSSDVDAMVVKADLALYKAKENGKNGWRLFEAAMDQAFRNRQVMKADLRQAVETGNLRVVYQPIVSMETMRIVRCEALCRWDHPEIGPISPSVFIPLAEEMGIISEISSFMLSAATAECAKWPASLGVSVNLSAKDFHSHDIVRKVKAALDKAELAPERLEIEITETALLNDKSSTRQYIQELKSLGVRIALDDFGTGYSSLSYLHSLPLDKVKIDRSFLLDVTKDSRSLELLKGIVNLSRPLGLAVTIEGVETFEQLKTLAREVKPDLVQGFLFGSALTASGIATMSNTTWPFAAEIHGTLANA
ncbi:EAL domain-containing protein [Aquamicrobium sp. LC103]|uniref:putative bifunctional diguanylate cyclase/phosphodiesterase n=1 Tax=Aquamicrobium sp. LC103 TaxID=1120658 RepID=UPI00063ECB4E|nr:EAL domain-containing protein [Aquamicrobium sp. LC103]TKT77599.1 EAL domain-containing protein [Aquamicrobium sp. LC103]